MPRKPEFTYRTEFPEFPPFADHEMQAIRAAGFTSDLSWREANDGPTFGKPGIEVDGFLSYPWILVAAMYSAPRGLPRKYRLQRRYAIHNAYEPEAWSGETDDLRRLLRMFALYEHVRDPANPDSVSAHAELTMLEVLCAIEVNPDFAACKTFAQLHDLCDGNTLGAFFDPAVAAVRVYGADAMPTDKGVALVNETQDAVHKWLAAGRPDWVWLDLKQPATPDLFVIQRGGIQ